MNPDDHGETTSLDMRKVLKEVKDELLPLVQQEIEFQVEKANGLVRNQLRGLEAEILMTNQRLNKRFS